MIKVNSFKRLFVRALASALLTGLVYFGALSLTLNRHPGGKSYPVTEKKGDPLQAAAELINIWKYSFE